MADPSSSSPSSDPAPSGSGKRPLSPDGSEEGNQDKKICFGGPSGPSPPALGCGAKASRPSYKITFSLSNLGTLMKTEGPVYVEDLAVSKERVGKITFLGKVDIFNLDFDREVVIDHKSAKVGSALEAFPALVELQLVYPLDKETGGLIMDLDKINELKYEDQLKELCEGMNAQFGSYDPLQGIWKYRIGTGTRSDLAFGAGATAVNSSAGALALGCRAKATRPDYKLTLTLSQLDTLMKPEGPVFIEDLIIRRERWGKISYLEKVDIFGVNFDKNVIIAHKEVRVFPEGTSSTSSTSKLNIPAFVEAYLVYPPNFMNPTDGQLIIDVDKIKELKFEEELRRRCAQGGSALQFISYDASEGIFKLKVNRFDK